MKFFNPFENKTNVRARELSKDLADGTTYFDQNEREHDGAFYDEATGKEYKNDTDMDSESPEMSTVSESSKKNLSDLEDENAKLLREAYKDNPEILKELGLD